MTKYTSLETSRKLHEAFPDWEGGDYYWHEDGRAMYTPAHSKVKQFSYYVCPAYDTDYLLEKLPPVIQSTYDKKFKVLQISCNGNRTFHLAYVKPYDKEFRGEHITDSDSLPEALALLALELKKEGIL